MLELLWFWHGLLKMIDWFGVKEHLAELGMQTMLTCSTCNNITNVCKSGGECMHGSCDCPVGSAGKSCQVKCGGNRRCDSHFNAPECFCDGGDCCELTFVSKDHTCGKDMSGCSDAGCLHCLQERGIWTPNSVCVCRTTQNNCARKVKKIVQLREQSQQSQERPGCCLMMETNILAVGEPGWKLKFLAVGEPGTAAVCP